MELKIEYIPIDIVKAYDKNAKVHDREQIEQIKNSINAFGMNDPIAIWKDNVIIEGHGRVMACQELGFDTIPIIRLDHLNDQQRKAYCLAHNKLTMNTGFDLDLLQEELGSIIDYDMLDFGFFEEDMEDPDKDREAEEDGFEMLLNETPISKVGQIYKLGRHRLMVGDSTDPENIAALMDGEMADLLVTDPPYNVAYEGRAGKIMNDNMGDSQFRQFLVDAFTAANSALKPGGAFYIWHAESEGFNFRAACHDIGWTIKQCLIWNKNTMVLGRQDYQWKHEPCLYGWKDGAPHYFVDDRKNTTVLEDAKSLDFKKMNKAELLDLLADIFADKVSTTILDEKKPAASEYHPTMKPLKLIGRQVKNSSKPGQIVIDTFGGSGSTLMVCEQLDRCCRTIELDPKYADAIIERWETYTGEKAELIK